MTKTTLILPEQTEPKLTFPLLAQAKTDPLTVLFIAHQIGAVVVKNNAYDVGHYSAHWMSVDDRREWTILPRGTKVVIEQL